MRLDAPTLLLVDDDITVLSGFGAACKPKIFLASFSDPILYKPVDPVQLSQAVRTCLNGARVQLRSGARI